MDKHIEEKIFQMHAEVCKSMANPTRLRIMNLLREGEKSVEELRERLGLPKANLSQHLGILRDKGIVKTRREGVMIYYSLANPKIIKAFDIIREMLLEKLGQTEKLSRKARASKKGSG